MSEQLNNEDPKQSEIDNKDIIDSLDLPDTKDETEGENKVYDINISSINDVLSILILKKYDFVTFEPSDSEVKLDFRKDGVIVETKFIKYPLYSGILLKAKSATKLNLEVTSEEQEGTGEVVLEGKNLKLITKVVSSNFGEKLFLKATEIERKIEKKEVKKVSLSQMFTFILVTALIGLIVGGSFIAFIVLNAQTVEDVRFFSSLGISLNDINTFIASLTTVVFSVLVLAETIVLVYFLYKFFLTPKEFKKKKVKFGILGALFLIITLFTFAAWMIIDQKIKSLPNWEELSYGNVLLFDNDKLVNENFDRMKDALLNDTSYLIGPISIRFDLTNLAELQERRGITIEKYVWNFNGEIVETTTPDELIKKFDNVAIIDPKVTLIGKDILGKDISIEQEIPRINVAYVVGIEEKILDSGSKQVTFDAKSLEQLGSIEWYKIENLQTPIYNRSTFITESFVEDTIFVMKIKGGVNEIIKLFIIKGKDEISINGKIEYSRGINNDLEVTFRVEDIEDEYGLGFIEQYVWQIGNQDITKKGDSVNPSKSSEVKYTFSNYGEYLVSVTLTNSAGETKTISKNIELSKALKISEGMSLYIDGKIVENVIYTSLINEYLVNNLGIPSEVTFDAKNLKSDNLLYSLEDVEWDFDSDGDIDSRGKVGTHSFNSEGNYTVTANVKFVNRRNSEEIVELEQKILVETIRKEAIIDFTIDANSEYVPVTVKFDGSKSIVKDANIVKFTWDYGDGTPIEDRDAIVQGHIYTESGDYTIKMTATTNNGNSYSVSKQLVLKPTPQSVKITSSIKKAPVGQGIDFSSSGSEGHITSYRWDFGDGNISTEANPTHIFSSPGKYKVVLRLEFTNRNVLENNIEIEIY